MSRNINKAARNANMYVGEWLYAYDWATDDDMPKHPLRTAWGNLDLATLEKVCECEVDDEIVLIWKGARTLEDFLVRYARRFIEFDDFEECDAALFWRVVAFESGVHLDTFNLLYNKNLLREITEI